MNAGYASLRKEPEQWAVLEEERRLWDTTLADGLDRDEHWTDDGSCHLPQSKVD
jgi:hypothetical protein